MMMGLGECCRHMSTNEWPTHRFTKFSKHPNLPVAKGLFRGEAEAQVRGVILAIG